MPHVQYDRRNIYYEVHGEGEPLVILNGIMMATTSWAMFLPELTQQNQIILLDFLDQGQSDKMTDDYQQDLQVDVVKAVVDALELKRINLLGISYGGEIAMQFALKYGNFIDKLLLFNTTAWTNPWLADIGESWVIAAKTGNSELFYHATIPIIYSPLFYTKNIDWMNERKNFLYGVFTNDFLKGMIRLTNSANSHDVRDRLSELNGIETLIVGSDYDFITPDFDQKYIHSQINSSQLFILKNCGHASMYEKPKEFLTLIKGFISC